MGVIIIVFINRVRSRKRLVYPGHPASKKKQKKKVISALQRDPNDEQVHGRSTDYKPDDMTEDLEVERSVRKSTRTSVIVRQAERDAIRAAVQATMKVCLNHVMYFSLYNMNFLRSF